MIAAVAAVSLGLIGAIIGWAGDRRVSATIASVYYIVGCIVVILGMFPRGGFALTRGTMTRRRPTGPGSEPIFLLGLVLIGLGVVIDVTRPF